MINFLTLLYIKPMLKEMKLFKLNFIALLLITLSSFTFAQTIENTASIRGIIIDSSNNQPIAFATISLKIDGQTNLRSTLTKDDGSFVLEKVPFGKHQLSILSVGYNKKFIEVEVDANKNNLVLNSIVISQEEKTLKEVTVSTEKNLVKQEADRISYDVQSDPESKFQTALDMLRKVPLVTVDADDNIQVKGSSNFKVLINGRNSSLVARSPKDVFRAMPASSIVKIEVITNPPSKYDADGIAGIINVITTQKIESGYNGSISTRYNFIWGPGVNTNLTLKHNKFAVSAYYGMGSSSMPGTTWSNSRRSLLDNNTLNQEGVSKNGWTWNYLQTEMSYEFDTLNLLTAEIGWNPGNNNFSRTQNNSFYNSDGVLNQSFNLIDVNESTWNSLDLGLNYQKGFKKNKSQLLTLSYKYSPNINTSFNDVTQSNSFNYQFIPFQQDNRSGSIEQTYQIDYVQPINPKLDLETGVKAITRNNFSEYEFKYFDLLSNAYLIDSSQTNDFDYQQNVYSFYNSYNVKFDKWSLRAGLRLERTTVDANFTSSLTEVKQDYTNLIPSISIQRKLKDMSSINIGYTQRIERPNIWQLNPFVALNDPRFISYGNPNLNAVLTNNFELGYSTFKKGSINIGLNYSFADNTIQNITVLGADTISRTSFENVGNDKKLGLNGNINLPINKKINVNVNSQISYLWIEGALNGLTYKNSGIQGNLFAFVSYTLPKEYRLRMNFGYNSAQIQLQGQSNDFIFSSISVTKEFFNKNLMLSAQIANPFEKFRAWEMDQKSSDFVSSSRYQNFYRHYGFSITYKFGKLQGGVKKNNRSIQNDDTQQKSSGQQGG